MRRAWLVGALSILVATVACAPNIDRFELAREIESGSSPPILDVRSESEFSTSHVPGAVHIPFYSVWSRSDELPTKEGEPLVVYCEHGPRAGLARVGLWLAGAGEVRFLEGHMTAWKADGLPVAAAVGEGSDAGAESGAESEWVETAQAALKPFKQGLKGALEKGLSKGPEAAIDACRLEAPRIADSVATESLHVGRSSHRLRNPENAPRPWMRPILEELRDSVRDSVVGELPHRSVRIDDERFGYAEAIYMQPLCLTCHGTDLPQPLRERIREVYPQDQATGFSVGEFRGIFWVELVTRPGVS